MKNKSAEFSREESRIYKNYYRPSLNIIRFFKAILGVLISGTTYVSHHRNYKK